MPRDPYIATLWRQRRNRARAEGPLGLVRAVGVPLACGLALVPLARPIFLAFLDRDPHLWASGTEAVVLRAALVVIGWLSLDVYTALIRGPDRAVLAHLPVDAAAVVRADLVRVALDRWWLVPGAALVLSPIAFAGAGLLWALAVLVLAGAFVLGVVASAAVHLLAITVAEDVRWSRLLDMTRGNNPRAQAAFIYAPGLVLVGAGGVASRAAHGVTVASEGSALGWVELALPFVVAALCAIPLSGLAKASWFRGSAVIADIDARYATLSDPKEALRVYLDWVVRFLPARVRLFALNDLRHGWRMRRTAITGAWLAALVAFAAGWTVSEVGPSRTAVWVVLTTFVGVTQSLLLDRDVPSFLRHWLPPGGTTGTAARVVVLALWTAPVAALGTASVAMRSGLSSGVWLLGVGALAFVLATGLALLCGRLTDRGLALYGPVGAVVGVAFAAAVGTV